MHELLSDPVDVDVTFAQKRIAPTRVMWGKTLYDNLRVNLVHTAREGERRIYYFSVSDTSHFLKLRFDTELLDWRLVEYYSE